MEIVTSRPLVSITGKLPCNICQDFCTELSEGCFCIFRMEGSSPVFVFHRTKLKNQEYETLDHLECDLNLMFENAKRYNVPNSAIYKRVLKLQQVMQV